MMSARLNAVRRVAWPVIVFLVVFGGIAVGSTADSEPTPAPAASASVTPHKAVDATSATPMCLADESVIQDLKKQREELELRNKELADKEVELKTRERAIEEELKKIEKVRDDIATMENLLKKENEEKVTKLVETFETMSPKATAQLLGSVDEGLAAAAMSRMSTQRLAKVMNVMEPGRSSRLTEVLAGLARAKTIASKKDLTRDSGREQAFASEGATVAGELSVKGGDRNDGRNEQIASSAASNAGANASDGKKGKNP